MNILQYCSVCKAEYDMSVVPTSDGDDDGVVWLQCPSCKGFLPKVSSSAAFKPKTAEEDATATTDDDASESLADTTATSAETVATEADASPTDDLQPSATEPPDEPEPDDPLADMDLSQAVAYRPWETYAEGDVIHHLAWDDYGVVVAKETLPGNRKIVQVNFAEAGIVRLIEQEGDGP
ncbi:hypothetical protein H8E07_08175 [bacterium]|nr:hypothetical protein [bacterium]